MSADLYPILTLFALTIVAFILSINSSGTLKIILSYTLSTALLVVSILAFTFYHQNLILVKEEAEKERVTKQLMAEQEAQQKIASEKFKADSIANYLNSQVTFDTLSPLPPKPADAMALIIKEANVIASAILAVNIEDNSINFDPIVEKSIKFKSELTFLISKSKSLNVDKSLKGQKESLLKALNSLNIATNYFNLYFKSENVKEESERHDVYKQNATAAKDELSAISLNIR